MISRVGVLSSFQSPSSRFSFRAAKSNRALCASQGLISWSNDMVGVAGAIQSPILALLPIHRHSRLSPVTRDNFLLLAAGFSLTRSLGLRNYRPLPKPL